MAEKLVENVGKLDPTPRPLKSPEVDPDSFLDCRGPCFAVSKQRLKTAYEDVSADTFSKAVVEREMLTRKEFDTIYKVADLPKNIPEEYSASGAAGALFFSGLGDFHDKESVTDGTLMPGALVQAYSAMAGEGAKAANMSIDDYVRKHHDEVTWGHSFIFLEYVNEESYVVSKGGQVVDNLSRVEFEAVGGEQGLKASDSEISVLLEVKRVGMRVADQGHFNREVLHFSALSEIYGSNIGNTDWSTVLSAKGIMAHENLGEHGVELTHVGEKVEGPLPEFGVH